MKKLVSLFCSVALLVSVCVPVFATTNDNSSVVTALSDSMIIGNYKYYLSDNTKDRLATYLIQNKTVQIPTILLNINGLENDIRTVHESNKSLSPSALWNTVKNRYSGDFTAAKKDLGITGVSFSGLTLTVTDKSGAHTFTVSYSKRDTGSSSSSSSSTSSTSSSNSTPSEPTVTASKNADGSTSVGVATNADSAPTVSGSTSSLSVTVPESSISYAIAAATSAKQAKINVSLPNSTIVGQINSSAVKEVSVAMKLPSNVAYGTAKNANIALNLDASVLQAAKTASKDVTVNIIDQTTGKEAYSWTFKGNDLAKSSSIGNVNMAVKIMTSTLSSTISRALPSSNKGVVLSFANNGVLPASATVKVMVSDQGYKAGQTLHMYYYNTVTGKFETTDTPACTVDKDGYVSVSISHCSDYVLLPNQVAAVSPVKVDTGSKITVKAGKAYQFKVTASAKPTFVCGNSSVFKVIAKGSKGNDYFFEVLAVGKKGQVSGFYVNGAKQPCTIGTIA